MSELRTAAPIVWLKIQPAGSDSVAMPGYAPVLDFTSAEPCLKKAGDWEWVAYRLVESDAPNGKK